MTQFESTLACAQSLDVEDPLGSFRDKFFIPRNEAGEEYIYFVGHSLGLQPKIARSYVEQELDAWETYAVEGHFKGQTPWMKYHEFLSDGICELVGANPNEVVTMNTLSVNVHLMLVSFYRPTSTRYKILIEGTAFPSDRYAITSQIQFHGYDPETCLIELQPRAGEHTIRTEDIEKVLEEEGEAIALVLLGGVNYLTGQAFEMEKISKMGHHHGCMVGYDLAHAVGNIELHLHDWNVDFAIWCSYKYLNGGPGCVAGCFIHDQYAYDTDIPRFAGWWGHNKTTRFEMPPGFDPIPGAEGWQISNPPILPMATLRASLDIFMEAGIDRLLQKSHKLTGFMEFMIDQSPHQNITIATPKDPKQRGCMLSFRIGQNGAEVFNHLSQANIHCDWREPDVIRAAPVPLYNTYTDVFRFVEAFTEANRKIIA